MELRIRRVALKDDYTIGKLEINTPEGWIRLADTLEDKVRDYNKDGDLNDANETKVDGETAIPYGKYVIDMNSISPRFKSRDWGKRYNGIVPLIANVKHFEGIRIHPTITRPEETHGCVGVGWNTTRGRLTNTINVYYALMDKYLIPAKNRGEKITLEIV